MNATLRSPQGALFRSPLAWLLQPRSYAPRAALAAKPLNLVRALEGGATIEVEAPRRSELVCLSGWLWITHDSQPNDRILARGDRYLALTDSRMLVHAIDHSRFLVCPQRP
jgi:hypothetical protein